MTGMIALAVGILTVVVLTILVGAIVWTARRRRRCPSCGSPLVLLGAAWQADANRVDDRPYEVLVCPHCTTAITTVAGERARFAWCPECRQQTLETPCIRLPDTDDGRRRVEVHESCEMCHHMQVREVADPTTTPAKKGQVIPFPSGGRKKPKQKSMNDE